MKLQETYGRLARRVDRFVIRVFCFHLNWRKYDGIEWRPERRFGKEIYQCKNCGKIKGFDHLNPPINYDV